MSMVRLKDAGGDPVFIRAESVTGIGKAVDYGGDETGNTRVTAGGCSWLVDGAPEAIQATIANAEMPVGDEMMAHLVAVRNQVADEGEGHSNRMEWTMGGRRALELLATRLGLVLPD